MFHVLYREPGASKPKVAVVLADDRNQAVYQFEVDHPMAFIVNVVEG